jgi:hypothetical protein
LLLAERASGYRPQYQPGDQEHDERAGSRYVGALHDHVDEPVVIEVLLSGDSKVCDVSGLQSLPNVIFTQMGGGIHPSQRDEVVLAAPVFGQSSTWSEDDRERASRRE